MPFAIAALIALACSNDYDEFEFVAADSGVGGSAGTGGGGASGSAACTPGETACAGQCVSLENDSAHCGACGAVCPTGLECIDGSCRCDSSGDCGDSVLADCRSDGRCECGPDDCRPGERCAGQGGETRCSCNGGEACTGDDVCCGAGCVDLDDDEQNCGRCGRACGAGEQCQAGSCEP
jgi:hypothetical protein